MIIISVMIMLVIGDNIYLTKTKIVHYVHSWTYFISIVHSRVANTTITVDFSVCARVPQNDEAVVNVSCENLMNGRRVRITKDDNASERYLSIAEFQILGKYIKASFCITFNAFFQGLI